MEEKKGTNSHSVQHGRFTSFLLCKWW